VIQYVDMGVDTGLVGDTLSIYMSGYRVSW
jgi:hypothetical protein